MLKVSKLTYYISIRHYFSSQKSIFLVDVPDFDLLIHDIPQHGLYEDISKLLKKPYLTKVNLSREQIVNKRQYKGSMYGKDRLFITIPTAYLNENHKLNDYYWVHYLLNTGSPISTLTTQARLVLSQNKEIPDDFFKLNIGGKGTMGRKSKIIYHNANMLGTDFFGKYKRVLLDLDYENSTFIMKLI